MPPHLSPIQAQSNRLKLIVHGAVQGVGFRPFVFRLATELHLAGWVNNSVQGLFIEVEGPRPALEQFLLRLQAEPPPRASIHSLEASWLDPAGYTTFEIRHSQSVGARTALVLPDIATCPDCLREIFDPANRRYHYPFTNCTNCGPRFSIIESLPYDRPNTSMKSFGLCPACQTEYANPADRRFHAQPNACPMCGPQLEFWDQADRSRGREPAANLTSPERSDRHSHQRSYAALLAAAAAIRKGRIVAVKGLGGFHLMVDARNDAAVRRLRERKQREEKPLAMMFPSCAQVKAVCEVAPLEERLLRSPEAPIVLLRTRHLQSSLRPPAPSIAPNNPYLGVMLPYTPLHHLLLAELGFPVVATSGNLSDEPICIDEHEAVARLQGIADGFLVHNRPIVRQVDDSIVRVLLDRELVLRRARGYAPLPVRLRGPLYPDQPAAGATLAVGAHLKNSVALAVGSQVFISQHIGDLETEPAYTAFHRVIADFQRLYAVRPDTIVCDLHPDYLSTQHAGRLAEASGARRVSVQHHLAHVFSCMAENELAPPVLGVSWDGTGYGSDGTVWGGEFFLITDASAERVAHLRPFRLPGGDQAVKEPRRSALGLLFAHLGEAAFKRSDLPGLNWFTAAERQTLRTMLAKGLNAPLTSSIGRLFDAVAALAGLRDKVRFEGQAAMELEFALADPAVDESYPTTLVEQTAAPRPPPMPPPALQLDWAPLLDALLVDVANHVAISLIAARFHNALAEAIVAVARRQSARRVVLTGGCFQNRYLTERAVGQLRAGGFQPYWHQRVPPNDGGIALGQVLAACRQNS